MTATRGNFFAIDRRSWAAACRLGLNEAAVLLILARGTGADQSTTAWSANAVEKYTGISRSRAKVALHGLIEAGLVLAEGSRTKPIYRLVEGSSWGIDGTTLSDDEKLVCELVSAGRTTIPENRSPAQGWAMSRPRAVADRLVARDMLRGSSSTGYAVAPDGFSKDPRENWIWMPNAIIDGVGGETPPLERIRRLHEVSTLQLFVDLYRTHALLSDGGLPWRLIRQAYDRVQVGLHGRYVLWSFSRSSMEWWDRGPLARFKDNENSDAAWNAFEPLVRVGLVECIRCLVEADSDIAEIIHPCPNGLDDSGTEAEIALGVAAREASSAMANALTEMLVDKSGDDLIAIPDEFPDVQMVGVYRLRYRPHTSATAAWFAQTSHLEELTKRYEMLRDQVVTNETVSEFPTSWRMRHQR